MCPPENDFSLSKKLINLFIALSCQECVYTISFMIKNIRMATQGSKYLYLFVYYKCCLFKKSVYCFYNAFLHLLVSKSSITSLISLFKYKLFRNIIVFNQYLLSGPVHPYPFPILGVIVCLC